MAPIAERRPASPYTGRFAPTPSGPLHLGSLLTAVASWLDARAHDGRWLLRIDDLDAPRIDTDAESAILRTLEAHGLTWDGQVARQSAHIDHYHAALERLDERCFACRCTRRQLRGEGRYPGTCRDLGLSRRGNAVRIRTEGRITFTDRVQHPQCSQTAAGAARGHPKGAADALDDFIVQRRDGFVSYPLAVVVDDHVMGVDHVVRGADLLEDTPRQIFLMRLLGMALPAYAHLPVITEASGVKLSKHNRATTIEDRFARHNIATVLTLLGLDPPRGDIATILDWAIRHWDSGKVPSRPVVAGFVALA